MNSIAALPVIPFVSPAGGPPAEEMPTPIARRRYALSLASALASERCYEFKVWSRKKIPLLLQLEALWIGEVPGAVSAEVHALLADAIQEAGLKAADEASKEPHSAEPWSRRRGCKAASVVGI